MYNFLNYLYGLFVARLCRKQQKLIKLLTYFFFALIIADNYKKLIVKSHVPITLNIANSLLLQFTKSS